MDSRTRAQQSFENLREYERRFQETDKNLEETIRLHLNETTEPTRRELSFVRSELVAKSDHITRLQHHLDEEKLKRWVHSPFSFKAMAETRFAFSSRQRLEMKFKRLKEEYINLRKELYSRIEDNNTLRHELVEHRFKHDHHVHMTNPSFHPLRTVVRRKRVPRCS